MNKNESSRIRSSRLKSASEFDEWLLDAHCQSDIGKCVKGVLQHTLNVNQNINGDIRLLLSSPPHCVRIWSVVRFPDLLVKTTSDLGNLTSSDQICWR